MKFRTKLGIFLIACLLTFVGFNLLIPAGAVDIMKIGKTCGYKISSDILVVDVVKDSCPMRG